MNYKAKICYRCNEYIVLYPDNPKFLNIEKEFTFKHRGHPTQIVNLEEAQSFHEYEKKLKNEAR